MKSRPPRASRSAAIQSGRSTWALAATICALFGWIAWHRAAPFIDDVSPSLSAGDDWLAYKQNALDILHAGWTIPTLHQAYFQPGGFLYCHFVAVVFAVFGINTTYVYLVQMALAGLTVVLFYLAFRPSLSAGLGLVLLPALAAIVYFDGVSIWGRYLLSENLAVPFVAAGMLVLSRAVRTDRLAPYALSGVLFGLVALTRQSLLFAPLAVMAAVAATITIPTRRRLAVSAAFLSAAAAVIALLPLRNGLVTGHFSFSGQYTNHLPANVDSHTLLLFADRILFTFGIVTSGLGAKPLTWIVITHWLVVCLAAVVYVIAAVVRRKLSPMDAASAAFLLAAFGPFIVLPTLGAYGMRFQLPYAAVMLFLAFRLIDLIVRRGAPHRIQTARVKRPIVS